MQLTIHNLDSVIHHGHVLIIKRLKISVTSTREEIANKVIITDMTCAQCLTNSVPNEEKLANFTI